jgi:hypothetical protein
MVRTKLADRKPPAVCRMSALHLKADVCGALAYVCFGPEADVRKPIRAAPCRDA